MSDQKNPNTTTNTNPHAQRPDQATKRPNAQESKGTPEDNERRATEASRTQANKPQDRKTGQPGQTNRPENQAGKR